MTRRECLALGGMALAAGCQRGQRGGFAGYALIATAGEKSLAVIDLTTFRLVRQIGLGAFSSAVLTGGPAGLSYALTPETGTVHAISGELKRTVSRQLAPDLSSFQLSSDQSLLLATGRTSRELILADARTLEVVRRFKLAAAPAALDVTAGGLAATSSGTAGIVELVDLRSGRQLLRRLGTATGGVRFRADGKLLLAPNLTDRLLTALDTERLETVVELPLAMEPQNLCFNADQGQLFVSGPGMDAVAIVFPYDTVQVEQTVLAGRDPGVMACSAGPAYLFVASASGSDISILNVETRKPVGIVEVGQKPSFIAITPDSQYALVLDESSGDVAVIHIPAIRSQRAKSGSSGYTLPRLPASLFTLIPVGSRPVHAAVVSAPV